MHTQQSAVALVRQFVAEVRQFVPLRQVVLFGSYVRGEQHEWSDIDVALVADHFIDTGFLDIRPFAALCGRYAEIEPHPFSTRRFESGDSGLAEEIKRTGIVIA